MQRFVLLVTRYWLPVTGASSAIAQTVEIAPITLGQFENVQWYAEL